MRASTTLEVGHVGIWVFGGYSLVFHVYACGVLWHGGTTPRLLASSQCERAMVSTLYHQLSLRVVKRWPSVMSQDDGTTPLCTACRGGHVAVVKSLLARGATVNLSSMVSAVAVNQHCVTSAVRCRRMLFAVSWAGWLNTTSPGEPTRPCGCRGCTTGARRCSFASRCDGRSG